MYIPTYAQTPLRPSEDWGNIEDPIISVETDGMELSIGVMSAKSTFGVKRIYSALYMFSVDFEHTFKNIETYVRLSTSNQ